MTLAADTCDERRRLPEVNKAPPALSTKALLILIAVAVTSRGLQFGNPVVQIDEEFYLLAGDRLLHGVLPFAEIWDRKPFGLFAIFAGIRLLGGSGIIQYQIVATVFVAATAATIARIALRLTNERGATVSGIVYAVFILSSGGDGGQAPVFYNLLVAFAALAVVQAQERARFDATAAGGACLAMALLGVAMQIKYTVVFEGIFFGMWLLALAWRRGVGPAKLAGLALLWCAIAALPTALVCALYWQRGVLDQLVFANFISIFQRSPNGLNIPARLFAIVAHIALPAAVAVWGMRITVSNRAAHRFVKAWVVAALIGVAAFGTYHYHYALPLFVPLAVAGAPIYGNSAALLRVRHVSLHVGHVVMAIGLLIGLITMIGTRRSRGTGHAAYAAAQMVGLSPKNCIFVFIGDPILYHLTKSCLPTPFLFPTFLSEKQDSVSLGVDPLIELRAVMVKRPGYVFLRENTPVEALPAAWAFMRRTLSQDYHLVLREKAGTSIMLGYKRCNLAGAGCRTQAGAGMR